MNKSVFMRILLIPMSLLVIVCVVLIGILASHSHDINAIDIQLENGEQGVIEFKALGLVPGEAVEYTVNLEGDYDYEVNIKFVETEKAEDKGLPPLKDFAYVLMTVGDEVLCHTRLSEVFEEDGFFLALNFSEDINTELKVMYYLPIEVGNEAENAVADFQFIVSPINYANDV